MGQRSSKPIFDFRNINFFGTTINNVGTTIINVNMCQNCTVVRSAGPSTYVEEGVSACDFDELAENPPTNEKWLNTISEWGVELVDTYENLDEKLYEEWLQERHTTVNTPPKQISYAVEE